MNFLAHLYLSGTNPETIFGNFIGDGVKGKESQLYDQEIQKGIALHRFIDTYTDNHPVTFEARKTLRPFFRKYAGVVLDVYFDHFLGNNWNSYHHQDLEHYVKRIEEILSEFEPIMPQKSQRFFHYMKRSQCLLNYREFEPLSDVFFGMAGRTSFVSNMEKAIPVLKKNYDPLNEAFLSFFPDLQKASAQHLSQLHKVG